MGMASVTEIGTLIDRDPKIRGGRPKLAGTGLTVSRIACWYKMGLTPEEIALEYPRLTLAQVHAVLAYYHVNRDEIGRFRHFSGEGAAQNLGRAFRGLSARLTQF